jgi:hypothetical protein
MGWDDPRESMQKERWEKLNVEESYSAEALQALSTLAYTMKFPECSGQAVFLIRARLEWAESVCLSLEKWKGGDGSSWLFPPMFQNEVWDALLWLVSDCYDSFPVFPRKWWDGSSFERYYE